MAKAHSDIFRPEEREALRPPLGLKPSEWAERYRVLPPGASNIPGPWRNSNAPYLRGIMDLGATPGILQLNILKAGQIGVSEALRNLLLFWAITDPDPVGLALPDRVKGRHIVTDQIVPAFRDTPEASRLFSARKWDLSAERIRLLNGFLLSLMWAGSASSTSAEALRRVINDEVDKFAAWAGRETNPVGRTMTRIASYEDRGIQINASTPTDRLGNIWKLWEASAVQLQYMVPCPGCNACQYLSFRQLKWPHPAGEGGRPARLSRQGKRDLADRIVANSDVWYLCVRCGRRIEPMERNRMVREGRWRSLDGMIEDAEAVAEWPRGTRVGMQVNAMSCLWISWASIASDFIRAEGDLDLTFSFRTEKVGEPWEEQIDKPRASVYADKSERAELEQGTVPAWAVKLLATVDTQQDHFYFVLRAWGPEMKSQRVFHCRAESFAELDDLCFRRAWPVEGERPGAAVRRAMQPEMVLIDSGGTTEEGKAASRTMEVYRWVMRRRARARAIKGAGAVKRRREGLYIWPGKGFMDVESPGRSKAAGRSKRVQVLTLWFLDTHHFGDLLADLIAQGTAEDDEREEGWLLNRANDEEYNGQLSNVQKRLVRTGRGPSMEVWEPSETGAPNHYWDCEVYQVAAAYMAHVDLLPSAEEMEEYRKAMSKAAPPASPGLAVQHGKRKIRAHY